MDWKPISEERIWDNINSAYERMNFAQKRLWEVVKIDPEKWQEGSYGKVGGGFWVVAIIGKTVIWFNDIEDGFNQSKYNEHGEIDEYSCNQDELEWALQNLLNEIGGEYAS